MTEKNQTTRDTGRPASPPPEQRREPLPWQTPKPPDEDPDAYARVEAIMASPNQVNERHQGCRHPVRGAMALQYVYLFAGLGEKFVNQTRFSDTWLPDQVGYDRFSVQYARQV